MSNVLLRLSSVSMPIHTNLSHPTPGTLCGRPRAPRLQRSEVTTGGPTLAAPIIGPDLASEGAIDGSVTPVSTAAPTIGPDFESAGAVDGSETPGSTAAPSIEPELAHEGAVAYDGSMTAVGHGVTRTQMETALSTYLAKTCIMCVPYMYIYIYIHIYIYIYLSIHIAQLTTSLCCAMLCTRFATIWHWPFSLQL